MRARSYTTAFVILVLSATAFAAGPASAPAPLDECTTVIAYSIPGSTADRTAKAMVVVPHEHLSTDKRFSVIYLLHGYGVSYARYYEKFTEAHRSLTALADRFGVILVMPDGGCCSWYLDAESDQPDAADWQYEQIITKHLVPEIDRRFHTWSERTGRGLTGMSMGGHGALYLCARHPELFSAAGSMSGVMDLRESLNPAPLAARIGTFEQHRQRWIEHSVLGLTDKFVGQQVSLLLDVGEEDPFIWSNRILHDKLLSLGVAHDYIERPGKHEWPYWINALPYHLQFLSDHLKPAGR